VTARSLNFSFSHSSKQDELLSAWVWWIYMIAENPKIAKAVNRHSHGFSWAATSDQLWIALACSWADALWPWTWALLRGRTDSPRPKSSLTAPSLPTQGLHSPANTLPGATDI
jgi:hypothetical protein